MFDFWRIKMAKPFFKWAGGKRQILNNILNVMPQDFGSYHEPFLGGGAVFFGLQEQDMENNIERKYYLSDLNHNLISAYEIIKDNPGELVKKLIQTESIFLNLSRENKLVMYENIRNSDIGANLSEFEKAHRFIFLMKTCFNGIYRENSKGYNNVPMGSAENPNISNEEKIKEVHHALKNAIINHFSFDEAKKYIETGDVVYLDPPYVPLNRTSNFTSYTSKQFTEKNHIQLKEFMDEMTEKQVYVIQSNSYCDYVLDLYKDYNVFYVEAKRMLNSKADSRGKIKEAIILNYNL